MSKCEPFLKQFGAELHDWYKEHVAPIGPDTKLERLSYNPMDGVHRYIIPKLRSIYEPITPYAGTIEYGQVELKWYGWDGRVIAKLGYAPEIDTVFYL